MLKLFFGDVMSILTTVFVLAMLAFVVTAFVKRGKITKWGRLILLFIVVGTAISGLSATRDAYMMENALFAADSIQSLICSVAGGLIFLTGIVMIFLKKQTVRRGGFMIISGLFLVQVLSVEISRVVLL